MKKYFTPIIIVISIAFVLFLVIRNNKKTGYVNTYMVYEQFKLKKELEDKLKKTQLSRQVILDSLKAKMQLTVANETLKEIEKMAKINDLKENYYIKEKQFNQENEAQASQYTNQIWEQLNQYVKEFGQENKFTYIFGANGQGGIMYANEDDDLTKEVIEYVNRKYDGHK